MLWHRSDPTLFHARATPFRLSCTSAQTQSDPKPNPNPTRNPLGSSRSAEAVARAAPPRSLVAFLVETRAADRSASTNPAVLDAFFARFEQIEEIRQNHEDQDSVMKIQQLKN